MQNILDKKSYRSIISNKRTKIKKKQVKLVETTRHNIKAKAISVKEEITFSSGKTI